jgi:hypothetical protein
MSGLGRPISRRSSFSLPLIGGEIVVRWSPGVDCNLVAPEVTRSWQQNHQPKPEMIERLAKVWVDANLRYL